MVFIGIGMPRRYVPKLSRSELERRRLEAGKQLLAAKGRRGEQRRIAKDYGVSEATASRWAAAVQRGGLDALRSTKAQGKKAFLTPTQKDKLRTMLLEGARRHGYENDLWTSKRITDLIRKKFGVAFSHEYLPQLLRDQLGFTWHKPTREARELDPEKVKRFLRTWVYFKKRP